ncbi:putative TetR family transcriptional regulator [Gordonia rubripertincta NBRC 101908]|uniref:TetR family transcriptional regulator n=1 Tax=Gordonia rubripertincta NBRC 101908 TaxID=1077975 RepID=A0ABQ0HPW3_GORRU|nr:HTH-type transcriptional repressor FabR [Gordonia rubripertincta]GAB84316.1 putative TetR family transcriptional regulator [Gordonia rubripertincta NBRC 101908]
MTAITIVGRSGPGSEVGANTLGSVTRTRSSDQRDAQTRADKKNQTRQALLDSTRSLVGERSFGSISLREVARGAGIVPTAFYRHFASMEDLGVTVVEDSMRVLRRALREGRRDLAARQAMPTAKNSLDILLRHVRENESQFRFLIREQHGGIAEIRRAIDTELRLFAKELTIDLARIPDLAPWQPEDLEIAAELIVTIMLTAVADLLDGEYRGRGAEKEIVERTERQLVMVFLGMGQWRPSD